MQIKDMSKSIQRERRRNNASKTRVYVEVPETILENVENRRNRPYKEWKQFAEKALTAFGVSFQRVGWSQKAGCSCGCSPGFVAYGNDRPGFDIHVSLEA